jgi:hypothetical protein
MSSMNFPPDEAPRVYVPQVPSRIDPNTHLWVPTVNLAPARKYGEVVVMLPPEANRMHTAPLVAALKESMRSFRPFDYVVAVGDPSLIMAAGCIASRATGGRVRVLKWEKRSGDYLPVELVL